MKTITDKTLPYRKCERVYQRLLENGIMEISRITLRNFISQHCAASQKSVEEYERRFVEFEFLKIHPRKTNIFLVDRQKFFSQGGNQDVSKLMLKTKKARQLVKKTSYERHLTSFSEIKNDCQQNQSKTRVYPTENEKKKTCSFKGYSSIWNAYKKAVWADGFPDICYVEHIFHSAYLNAIRSKVGRIDVPLQVRDMNFFITINAPYIVQRPRRKITYNQEEIIEEY